MDLIIYPNEVLTKRAIGVTDLRNAAILGQAMKQFLKTLNGYGLAAPQVGLSVRVFVMELSEVTTEIVINPKMGYMGKEIKVVESCLSIPGEQYEVTRYDKIRLTYLNFMGSIVHRELTRDQENTISPCIIAQHEFDHLNGVLINQTGKRI
jgi:peptide deformylase